MFYLDFYINFLNIILFIQEVLDSVINKAQIYNCLNLSLASFVPSPLCGLLFLIFPSLLSYTFLIFVLPWSSLALNHTHGTVKSSKRAMSSNGVPFPVTCLRLSILKSKPLCCLSATSYLMHSLCQQVATKE